MALLAGIALGTASTLIAIYAPKLYRLYRERVGG